MPGSTASLSALVSCQPNGGVVTATISGAPEGEAYEVFLYGGTYLSQGAPDGDGRVFTFTAVPNSESLMLAASIAGTSGGSPGDGEPVGEPVSVRVACNGPTPPAAGSFLRLQCQGLDQYRITADGTGGEVSTLEQANSPACGYVPPVDPDPEPTPEPEAQWVSLWALEGIPVEVEAEAGGPAFVEADLYAGFPDGHPLATGRPLTFVAAVRATVAPSGVATLNLAPYLRSEVGALLRSGSRRLDYNSPAALTQDLYVGYSLTRGGATLSRGYALNSVLSAEQLLARPLTPFGGVLPIWPGYSFASPVLDMDAGVVEAVDAADSGQRLVHMPCPRHGLPVVWLCPEGGYGYWVFSGNPVHGDEVGEGQPYTEAGTQELRYSSRAASRATVEAYSGVFSERAFVEGLRTLRRAVQAWYQPEGPGTAWVPIVLKGGTYPAYREGRRRYEATISFSEARPQFVQGQ